MSPVRENLVEVARLVRLVRRQGLRSEVDETIGVPIATFVNHFPHQLKVGLDHARMELAISVSSQVTFFKCCAKVSDCSLMDV